MGNCNNGEKYDKEAAQINREIESRILKEKRQFEEEHKLLLLGTGESGKSTIAKQMKIIHLTGFSKEEKMSFRPIVYSNTVRAAAQLINIARKKGIDLPDPDGAEMIEKLPLTVMSYPPELGNAICRIYSDPRIQPLVYETGISDSAPHFLSNADKYSDPNYIPNEVDILRVRVKTTGISETVFLSSEKNRFRMVDVGGQRNERKKWIHCFQDVTAIIFCVAANEYDMVLEEDNNVNRMHESLKLFGDIINNEWFWNTKVILFLNKDDLLREKCKRIDLSVCFPNYDGGLEYEKVSKYIEKKFLEKNKNNKRKIYHRFTCATDTSNIRYVFSLLEGFLFQEILDDVFGGNAL